jgi:inner membrane protein
MASFGHVAVGLLTGRLHGEGGGGETGGGEGPGGSGGPGRGIGSWKMMVVFAGLALLPDADVLLVALGACDAGACGHRGASHSLPLALAIGLVGAYVAHRLRWPVVRTAIATTFAVGSHALLDVLGAGGRGLPLFWPFSSARFTSPIRIFPDAPRGQAFLSRPGATSLAVEFAVFLPMMVYALWPRISAWLSARAMARRIPQLPNLTFLEGGAGLSPATASAAAPAAVVSEHRDPPIRSAG